MKLDNSGTTPVSHSALPAPVRVTAPGVKTPWRRELAGALGVAKALQIRGAVKLGALIVGAVLFGGCLLPQEDDILDDPPPALNRPPRLLGDRMNVGGTYSNKVTVGMGTDCPQVVFEGWVEDPDIADTVRYRWFVDYNPSATAPLIQRRPVATGTLATTGEPLRAAVTWAVTPESVDNPLTPGVHLVQLIVTDGILEIEDAPTKTPPPDPVEGVDGGNPRYIDEYSWYVTVDTSCGVEVTQ